MKFEAGVQIEYDVCADRVDIARSATERTGLEVARRASRLADISNDAFALIHRERELGRPTRPIEPGGVVAQPHDFFHEIAKQQVDLVDADFRLGKTHLRRSAHSARSTILHPVMQAFLEHPDAQWWN